MNRYLLEAFHNDPALRRRLFQSARRERNRTIRAALAWLRKRLTPSHPHTPRWIARLG